MLARCHRIVIGVLVVALPACRAARGPAPLDSANDVCGSCRMVVSDQRFASQIVAPNEDPQFFDDMGCLARYLATHDLSARARVYVADRRTAAWVPAERAVFTRIDAVSAAMGSHIVAHETAASRSADPEAAHGIPVDALAVFDGHLPGGGRP